MVEIFGRSGKSTVSQGEYLRFLLQFCERANDYIKTRRLRALSRQQSMWERLDSFSTAAHRSLDPRETAYTIANEARRFIGCDRVSVAVLRKGRLAVAAVSGQAILDPRSSTVIQLTQLVTAVAAAGEPVWYAGDSTDLAPQIEKALESYLDVCHSKLVAVLPLFQPAALAAGGPPASIRGAAREEPIGALVIEQFEEGRAREELVERVEVVRDRSTTAIANALEHHQLFLLPVWRALGRARWMVRARTLPKTIAASIAVLALPLFLAIIPAGFDLEGRGTLEPVVRRDVFAEVDGEVTRVHVKHGDLVERGELLAEMRNVDLEALLSKLRGDRGTALEQLHAVESSLLSSKSTDEGDEKRLSEYERTRLHGERLQIEQTLAGLDEQIALQESKRRLLEVRSPVPGRVVTWDVDELLIHRPVTRGDVLLTVVEPAQEWELKLRMPEETMGHVLRAQRGLRPGESLPVEFILATDPAATRQGQVKEIHYRAEVRGEEGNTVLVEVDFDERQLDSPYPGALVIAKIHCGRRSIGYVWFHDLIAFVQSRVLFRL